MFPPPEISTCGESLNHTKCSACRNTMRPPEEYRDRHLKKVGAKSIEYLAEKGISSLTKLRDDLGHRQYIIKEALALVSGQPVSLSGGRPRVLIFEVGRKTYAGLGFWEGFEKAEAHVPEQVPEPGSGEVGEIAKNATVIEEILTEALKIVHKLERARRLEEVKGELIKLKEKLEIAQRLLKLAVGF